MRQLNLLSGSLGFFSFVTELDATFLKKRPNSKRSEVISQQLTGPDTRSYISGVWHWCWWTVEHVSELETQSRVMLRVHIGPRGDCSHCQCLCKTAWICVRARVCTRRTRKLSVQREMWVNPSMELSERLSPLQPSATLITWTSMQQWWDVTGGISPSGAQKRTGQRNLYRGQHAPADICLHECCTNEYFKYSSVC